MPGLRMIPFFSRWWGCPNRPDEPFFIAFKGAPERFARLAPFYARLREIKARHGGQVDDDEVEAIVADPAWLDLLDAPALEVLTDRQHWDFESMLESILRGEYTLERLSFDGISRGVFVYEPYAGPFGGSESLVGLVETFGLRLTWDSWNDD
jgi:hypothetical protein